MTKQGSGQGLIAEREGGGLRLLLWPGLQGHGVLARATACKAVSPTNGAGRSGRSAL